MDGGLNAFERIARARTRRPRQLRYDLFLACNSLCPSNQSVGVTTRVTVFAKLSFGMESELK